MLSLRYLRIYSKQYVMLSEMRVEGTFQYDFQYSFLLLIIFTEVVVDFFVKFWEVLRHQWNVYAYGMDTKQ